MRADSFFARLKVIYARRELHLSQRTERDNLLITARAREMTLRNHAGVLYCNKRRRKRSEKGKVYQSKPHEILVDPSGGYVRATVAIRNYR